MRNFSPHKFKLSSNCYRSVMCVACFALRIGNAKKWNFRELSVSRESPSRGSEPVQATSGPAITPLVSHIASQIPVIREIRELYEKPLSVLYSVYPYSPELLM